jgi:NADH-ubiquinone oxidoreductase chain 6
MGFEFNKLLQDITNTKQISYIASKSWDGNLLDSTDIMSIGNIMYTSYSIWLLITSIILLLAMVGSIVITIKQKY